MRAQVASTGSNLLCYVELVSLQGARAVGAPANLLWRFTGLLLSLAALYDHLKFPRLFLLHVLCRLISLDEFAD